MHNIEATPISCLRLSLRTVQNGSAELFRTISRLFRTIYHIMMIAGLHSLNLPQTTSDTLISRTEVFAQGRRRKSWARSSRSLACQLANPGLSSQGCPRLKGQCWTGERGQRSRWSAPGWRPGPGVQDPCFSDWLRSPTAIPEPFVKVFFHNFPVLSNWSPWYLQTHRTSPHQNS